MRSEAIAPPASMGLWIRRVRLAAGLVLFAFVSLHLLNHALGLVSLEAMEAGRGLFLTLWRNTAGTALLYGALALHPALALWGVAHRRSLRLPPWEAVQLVLGLLIPIFLIPHVVGTRFAFEWLGTYDTYRRLLIVFWIASPDTGVRQVLLLALVWAHAGVGLHYWLRFRPWYPRAFALLLSGFLLLGALAALGMAEGGREVRRRAARPGWVKQSLRAAYAPGPAGRRAIADVRNAALALYAAALAGVLLARGARGLRRRCAGTVRVTYPGGEVAEVPLGFSVLEASRRAGIPHASVCGGRGRCSTCRVRLSGEPAGLPPAGSLEKGLLERVGAPPNVRLACQLRPEKDLSVVPLLPETGAAAAELASANGGGAGEEQEVTVLFADLRGFTRMSEKKLPYDVVFFLNSYFEAVGDAIERAGGVVNQFTGDGVMALFGIGEETGAGARRALRAARLMAAGLARMSRSLAGEFDGPLRMGIGVHTGPAVVGRMGRGVALYLTAVGDTVHVASRLQDLTKEYSCELIVSGEAARRAGLDVSAFPRREVTVRNRAEPIVIYPIPSAADLPAGA